MPDTRPTSVLHTLELIREELAYRVTEVLFQAVPIVGLSEKDQDPVAHHHHNMTLTANRFHEIVQAGAGVDWVLVSSEFGWADRKLGTMGVTRVHHQLLIDCYFQEALKLHAWTPEEQRTLEQIANDLRETVTRVYNAATG
jgi:hypothetical protein